MQKMENFGVDPGGFAVAIGVERIEADLHPLAQRDTFDVIHRDAILKRESRVVRPQWQTTVRRKSPEKDLHAATWIGLEHLLGGATCGAVELTVTDCDGVAAHVQDILAFLAAESAHRQRRRLEFLR